VASVIGSSCGIGLPATIQSPKFDSPSGMRTP